MSDQKAGETHTQAHDRHQKGGEDFQDKFPYANKRLPKAMKKVV